MAKAVLKTKENDEDVEAFIASVADPQQRDDCRALIKLLQQITKHPPKMWGASIVGFGSYHYKYASGREGDWFVAGFSPRKGSLSIYVMSGFSHFEDELAQLGKHKLGKCCLYLKRLEDADPKVLKSMLRDSVKYMKKHYPCT